MGCGSSTNSTAASFTAASPNPTHPNVSLVHFSGDGTQSLRKLKERPKRGSLTFGDEKEKEAKEQRERERDAKRREANAAALNQILSPADGGPFSMDPASPTGHSFETPFSVPPTPDESNNNQQMLASDGTDAAAAPTEANSSASIDEDADDSSSSSDESSSSSDSDGSMEEIEEETTERPFDEGGFTPMNGPTSLDRASTLHQAPTASGRPALARGGSLSKLLKSFSPENSHILIVDDDTTHMEIVAQWLAHKRYHVTLCNDGEEAVEVLSATLHSEEDGVPAGAVAALEDDPDCTNEEREDGVAEPHASTGESFDLILADFAMEAPDGTPLLDWVLKNPNTKRIPFVLMSNDITSQSCDRSLRRGAEDFYSKPLQRSVLLKNIRTILEQKCEQQNSIRLKQWGDKYKQQLLTEKKKKEAEKNQINPSNPNSPVAGSEGLSQVAANGSANETRVVRPHPELLAARKNNALQIALPDGFSPKFGASPLGFDRAPSMWLGGAAHTVTPHTSNASESGVTDDEIAIVSTATVLLVDPSDTVRESLSNWLASINYTLLVQPTMESALEFLRKTSSVQQSSSGKGSIFRSTTHLPSSNPSSGMPSPSKINLESNPFSSPTLTNGSLANNNNNNFNNNNLLPPNVVDSSLLQLDRLGSITEPPAPHSASSTLSVVSQPSTPTVAPPSLADAPFRNLVIDPASTPVTPDVSTPQPFPIGTSSNPPTTTNSKPASNMHTVTRSTTTNFVESGRKGLGGAKGSFRKHDATPTDGGITPMVRTRLMIQKPNNSICDLIIADAEPDDILPPSKTKGGLGIGTSSGMTGSEFIAAIQSNQHTKSIPVVLLYSNHGGADATDAIRHGVETVLVKPLSKELLLRKVNQILTTIHQRKKSDMYVERAQAYKSILTSFRQHREEEIKSGKRGTPMTPAQRKLTLQASASPAQLSLNALDHAGGSSVQSSPNTSPKNGEIEMDVPKKGPHRLSARAAGAVTSSEVLTQAQAAGAPSSSATSNPAGTATTASSNPLAAQQANLVNIASSVQSVPPTHPVLTDTNAMGSTPVLLASASPVLPPAHPASDKPVGIIRQPTPPMTQPPPKDGPGHQPRRSSNTFTFEIAQQREMGTITTASSFRKDSLSQSQNGLINALDPAPATATSNSSSTASLPPIHSPSHESNGSISSNPLQNSVAISASHIVLPPIHSGRNSPVPPPVSIPAPAPAATAATATPAPISAPAAGPVANGLTPQPPSGPNPHVANGVVLISRGGTPPVVTRTNSGVGTGHSSGKATPVPQNSPPLQYPVPPSVPASHGTSANNSPPAPSAGSTSTTASGDSPVLSSTSLGDGLSSGRNKIRFIIRDKSGSTTNVHAAAAVTSSPPAPST